MLCKLDTTEFLQVFCQKDMSEPSEINVVIISWNFLVENNLQQRQSHSCFKFSLIIFRNSNDNNYDTPHYFKLNFTSVDRDKNQIYSVDYNSNEINN